MLYSVFSNRASNVPVRIASSSSPFSVIVNQRVEPVGAVIGGRKYHSLGKYVFETGTVNVTIQTTGTNGFVVADAVALVLICADATTTTFLAHPAQRKTYFRAILQV